jgi:hypothetical protein
MRRRSAAVRKTARSRHGSASALLLQALLLQALQALQALQLPAWASPSPILHLA